MEYINLVIIICIVAYLLTRRDDVGHLCDVVKEVPNNVLKVIQGSINPKKGKLGELLTLLDIKGEYDIIIPIGQAIDVVAISDEEISFIEVKTGSARLTENERKIQNLIDGGKVNFRIVRYSIDIDDGGVTID
jgi:hypothetical protein